MDGFIFLTASCMALFVTGVVGFLLTNNPIYLLLPLYITMKLGEKL